MAAIESDNDSGSETQVMPGPAPDSPLVASILECPKIPPQATATAKADVENAKTKGAPGTAATATFSQAFEKFADAPRITQVLDEHDRRSHGKGKKAPAKAPVVPPRKKRTSKRAGA